MALFRKSPYAGLVCNHLYSAVMGETFRQLFERGAVAHVAINPNYPDQWLGLLVSERTSDGVPVVHTLFVKSLYRDNRDVTDSLFEAAGFNRGDRLFFTLRVGNETRQFPQGRHQPEIARRKTA